jgi:hypothetical protein
MRNRWWIGLALVATLWAAPVAAQITPTYVFVVDTVISPDEVNANFALLQNACNRTGCTMTGTMTARDIVPDGNNTRPLGGSSARWSTIYGVEGNFSGGLTMGSGAVALVGTDGRLNGPLSSTILDNLSAANLTNIPAAQLTGTIDNARLNVTPFALTLFDDADAAAARTTLGVAPVESLVCSGGGTSTSAVAVNVASCAISGLTNRDRLQVSVTLYNQGGTAVTGAGLYNDTDGVSLLTGVNNTTGTLYQWTFTVSGSPSSDTSVQTYYKSSAATVEAENGATSSFTTNYTGSWVLALRHAGTDGTLYWSWTVTKRAGQ